MRGASDGASFSQTIAVGEGELRWGVGGSGAPAGSAKRSTPLKIWRHFSFLSSVSWLARLSGPSRSISLRFFFQGQVDVRDFVRVQMVKAYASSDESDENLI